MPHGGPVGVADRRAAHADRSARAARTGASRTGAAAIAMRAFALVVIVGSVLLSGGAAIAAPGDPTAPARPGQPSLSLEVGGVGGGATQSVTIIALLTVLSVAPALLLLTTSFTKIAVVLALTRQALGTPTIPPNQVLAGLALFLSLFVMGPVLSQSYSQGVQPFMEGKFTTNTQALEAAYAPMRTFMTSHTGKTELQTMIALSDTAQPEKPEDVPATTLIPAFVLSELKTAFIIGFVIFIPFLIIDLVVASILMSMGMMMLPPVMISLPFKLLLFIMVDGWSLITTALVTSYR